MANINLVKTTVTGLRPIGDHILVNEMEFKERLTRGGLIILNDDMKSAGIRPRWAKVYALGPNVRQDIKEDVKVGDYILIAHGRWSRGMDIIDENGEQTVRKVDPNDILMVSEEYIEDLTMSDKA